MCQKDENNCKSNTFKLMRKNNHFIPWFHIKKWKELGSKIYEKATEKIIPIDRRGKLFAKRLFLF